MMVKTARYQKKQLRTPTRTLGKNIAIGILSAMLLMLGTLTLLISTKTGTRWLLQAALSSIKQVSVAEIKGRIMDEVLLEKLRYQDSNHFQVSISKIKFHWQPVELLQGRLHINLLQADGIDIIGQPAESENKSNNTTIPVIHFDISIDQLLLNQVKWRNNESLTKIHRLAANATLEKNILTVSGLELTMPKLQVNAQSTVELQAKWPLSGELDWIYRLKDKKFQGKLTLNGNLERMDLVSLIHGAIESKQTGYIKLTGDQPEFNLKGQWQKFVWPLSTHYLFNSHQGDIQIKGTLQNYQAKMNAVIAGNNQTNFSIAFSGEGNQNSMHLSKLLIKPAQGQLNIDGHLFWADGIAFNLNLDSTHLNPADLGTDIPGDLDLKAHGKGKIAGDKIYADLGVTLLTGTLYHQPLNAKGQFKLNGQQINIIQLIVSVGQNQLHANGWLNQQKADLAIDINAPDLRKAWPNLAGSLVGNAQVAGSIEKPIIKSKLKGNHIGYAGNRIGDIAVDADYSYGSKQQSHLSVIAKNAQVSGYKIKILNLQAQGSDQNHHVKLNFRSSAGKVNIFTEGQWKGQQWSGLIKQLDIDLPRLQQWRLGAPTKLILGKSKNNLMVKLNETCLIQNQASLCLSVKGSPDKQLNGQVSLSQWSLLQTKPWLPDELTLNGYLSAHGQLSVKYGIVTANMNADITSGKAVILGNDNKDHDIAFVDSKLRLSYQQDQINSQLYLGLANQDYLTAHLEAGPSNKTGIRQLAGNIKANINNIDLIDGLIRNASRLKGQLSADLKVEGNTKQPNISGFAKLQEGAFVITKLGSTFRNVNIEVNADNKNPDVLHLTAALESGKGKLSGQGILSLEAEHNYPLQMTIKGDKFQISRLPDAVVAISPSLTINRHGNLTKIEGLIKVDNAEVEMKTLPESAIAPSEDEVFLNSGSPPRKKVDVSRLIADIIIELGNNSHFKGFGLDTYVTGKLEYLSQNNQQKVSGLAVMKKATYRFYGQDLTIRKGEFLFNGPAGNPWVNISAIRKANNGNITAVLNVTGPLKSPETKVYTEPPLPESEALAYLVTGKSIKRMSEGDGSAVANAALNYGVGELSWIKDQLGIDEFEFKQSDTIEKSAVRLGHYLNPDLYVGVTMGLFASNYAANLRYRISDHFSISTRAGETQRIELKYHIDTE